MYKKLLISTIVLIFSIFSFTFCFANDATNMAHDAANGVKNIVGGAENTMQNAANGVRDAAKNTTQKVEEGMNKAGNSVANTMNSNTKNNKNMNNYNATRTSTGAATFMGMNGTTWTWLIMGIAAIAIIALVWYYTTQTRSSNYDDRS